MRNSLLFLLGIGLRFQEFFQKLSIKPNDKLRVAGNAIIKMSSIGITAISGKAGGSVYSRNAGGAYVKNFVMPTNTFSEARQAVRATFGAISSAWKSLTEAQRNSWVEMASEYPVTNSLGDEKVLNPNALFVRLNDNLVTAGLSQIQTAQPPQGTNAVIGQDEDNGFNLDSGGAITFVYDLEGDNDEAENEYVLEATPALSPSIRNAENKFRVLARSAVDGTTPSGNQLTEDAFSTDPATMAQAYYDKFGEPSEGDQVQFRIKAVNPVTGETSAYWYERFIVIDEA